MNPDVRKLLNDVLVSIEAIRAHLSVVCNRMKPFKNLLLFFLLTSFTSCIWAWDKLSIYNPNSYSANYDNRLLLNGYYFRLDSTNFDEKVRIVPIFFFKDGSACYTPQYYSSDELERFVSDPKQNSYFIWGNYIIKSDTLLVEYFDRFNRQCCYERNIDRYLIKNKQLDFVNWIDRYGKTHFNEKGMSYTFATSFSKPDSTKNVVRQKKGFPK